MTTWLGGAVPRAVHPVAWWAWALTLAVVAARTTNPVLLALVIAVAVFVVVARREDAPWARAIGLYLKLAVLIVVIRVGLRVLLGGGDGPTIVVSLPEIPLPEWMAGVRLGGDVSAEAVVAAIADGMRLAAIVVCFGAANMLANPRRLLRLLPNALYEIGAAVTVALSLAPQLAESVGRVRRAQRLRRSRHRMARRVLLPVLADALDRSVALAAAMDARGYGRTAAEPRWRRRATASLLVLGLLGACIGAYGALDTSAPFPFGLPSLVAGAALLVVGLTVTGRRTRHTTYRPDPWRGAEWAVVATSALTLALVLIGAAMDPGAVTISTAPLAWPTLPLLPAAGILVALAPAFVTPMPPLRAATEAAARRHPTMRPSEMQP